MKIILKVQLNEVLSSKFYSRPANKPIQHSNRCITAQRSQCIGVERRWIRSSLQSSSMAVGMRMSLAMCAVAAIRPSIFKKDLAIAICAR